MHVSLMYQHNYMVKGYMLCSCDLSHVDSNLSLCSPQQAVITYNGSLAEKYKYIADLRKKAEQ